MKKKNNARARARADVFFCLLFFKILFLLVSFVNLFKMSNLPCNKISGIVSSYLCNINRGPLRQTWFWNLHHLFWLETVMLCLIVEISAWNRWRSDFNLSVLKTRKVKRVLKSVQRGKHEETKQKRQEYSDDERWFLIRLCLQARWPNALSSQGVPTWCWLV